MTATEITAPITDAASEILTAPAVDFLTALARNFARVFEREIVFERYLNTY